MILKTLENISSNDILECFNNAFSDYQTPMHITLAQLESKIYSENVQMEYSLGAFDGDKLVGFILHGYDIIDGQKILYNAGTGVIPSHRGQKITEQMYYSGLPKFKEKGINKILLEVIASNERAKKVYQKIGFDVLRQLNCYKGNIKSTTNNAHDINSLSTCDWDKFQSFWNWQPTWQNSLSTVTRNITNLVVLGAYQSDELVGYIIYNPESKRVHQFAVGSTLRNRGVAASLFNYVSDNYASDISVINVDADSADSNRFLNSLGMENYVQQYQMELSI